MLVVSPLCGDTPGWQVGCSVHYRLMKLTVVAV